ncbi:MAG: hypothetical protein Q8T08_19445, partial [Ignavibacteria bacterium]|nr:hypothetical protein [Ignavibacteria bacterium]
MLIWLKSPAQLYIEITSDSGRQGEVYIDKGDGYLSENIPFPLIADAKLHEYKITIPTSIPYSIRIDPDENENIIQLGRIKIETAWFTRIISYKELRLLHNIEALDYVNNQSYIKIIGEDPYLDFAVISDWNLNNLNIKWWDIFKRFIIGIMEIIAFGIAILLLFSIANRTSNKSRLGEQWLTNPHAIVLYIFFILGFGIFLIFNLNVSSIGIWDSIIPLENSSKVLFGHPQSIRSDEWMV